MSKEVQRVVEDFLKNNVEEIQGLPGYTYEEVKSDIDAHVQMMLEDFDEGIEFIGSALHGSRIRKTAKETSDLDYVFEYKGDASEDTLFDYLNEEPFYIEDIQVDINPITAGKTGTLKQYMARDKKYDDKILNSL